MLRIEGEPVIFLSGNKLAEDAWVSAVQEQCGSRQFKRLRLALGVRSLKRRGHHFDLDNLAKLVLDQLCGQLESIWLTVEESPEPGAALSEAELPPAPEQAIGLRIAEPPTRSDRSSAPIAEALAIGQIGNVDEPLGIAIEFEHPASICDFGFTGPVKPLLDGLKPIYGMVGAHWADHRVRELRIRRGSSKGKNGVRVAVWKL